MRLSLRTHELHLQLLDRSLRRPCRHGRLRLEGLDRALRPAPPRLLLRRTRLGRLQLPLSALRVRIAHRRTST